MKYPLAKRAPIYLAAPQPARRALPIIKIVCFVSALALVALGYALQGDGGAVLAAIGCAVMFALVFKPARYATTERVYTVWGFRLRGDEETDRYFDEGR